ncbi:glycoside hydrolase family 140 protein [Chitinophaga rhizophila]|uniref:Glycoside hydrolase family 140 protein n=1 Tax=Chitinophaga rhizophila TaxID=2866212 RepID=A0ABS7G908_9BACT|nr:glycoside hydrolase family 140 protein [Chitinophaga rhizophila]MBW8684139.1 glycoside hydrolase family 140 protein [Chitinophaga rhizophila]
MLNRNCIAMLSFCMLLCFSGLTQAQQKKLLPLKVSANGRYFETSDGKPFFWLGDTGWLLFTRLTREETEQYLDDRRKKGFNVIQVMVLPAVTAANIYGDSALIRTNVGQTLTTTGNQHTDSVQYDYWDHVDFVVSKAAQKGLYLALVPVWGSPVKAGLVTAKDAGTYASFLADRYKHAPNIIWMNGGDIKGSDGMDVWLTIGKTLQQKDPGHLITFHPRGRTQSSDWFHDAPWLAFNMFQSGHRRYNQDTAAIDKQYGEDNWKYVNADYNRKPVKPVIDGEPSYEGIPQGLHDPIEPFWEDKDVRRYGYWSVFAGACGYTYGHNAVMQMHKHGDGKGVYGVREYWEDAINAPGAGQMKYLRELICSRNYAARIPDQSLIAEDGKGYQHLQATRGKDYAFIYSYTGKNMAVNMGRIQGSRVKAAWYDPRNGQTKEIGTYPNKGVIVFDPPGEEKEGNDWVLVMDSVK